MVSRSTFGTHRLRKLLTFLLACTLVTGCTVTTTPISADPSEIANQVNRGDTVNIVTTNGQQLQFSVEVISDSGLFGEGNSVLYGQIQRIGVEEKKLSTTGAWIIGGTIGALIGLALAWAISELIDSATEPDFD